MAINLLAVGAAAAGAYWYFFRRDPVVPLFEWQYVTGPRSGKRWRTRAIGTDTTGPEKRTTVEVYAPAGSWGPHADMLVLTYAQVGSRRERGISGADATDAQITAAISDFGLIDV